MTGVPEYRRSVTPIGGQVAAKLTADVGGRLALLALLIVAARTLTTADFGAYAYALAIGVIASLLADSGIHISLVQSLSAGAGADAARAALGRAVRTRTAVGVVLGAGAALLAGAAGSSIAQSLSLAVVSGSPVVIAQAELWLQVPRASGRLHEEAAVGGFARASLFAAGSLALLVGAGVPGLAAAHGATAVATLVVARTVAMRLVRPAATGYRSAIRLTYAAALPLAVAGMASVLMFRVDAVLLQWLSGADTVAVYTTAYRSFEAALLVSVALMAAAFPRLVRVALDAAAFRAYFARTALTLIGLALVTSIGAWVLGPPLVSIAFGPGYDAAGDILRILVAGLTVIYLNALLTQSLIALGRAWHVALGMAIGLAVNVVLNIALIPPLGAAGAALATVVAETALFVTCAVPLALVLFARRASSPLDG